MARDLFKVIVRKDRLNPAFKAIRDSKGFEPAREMLNEVFQSFDDVDGNFVEEFQSDGFNSRLWELYLDVFLKDSRFKVNRSYKRPDFEIEKDGRVVFVEAVTFNPTACDWSQSICTSWHTFPKAGAPLTLQQGRHVQESEGC